MAVEETSLGYQVPDGNERVKDGDNVIAHNARKNHEHVVALQNRLGVAMAMINAGAGGVGVSEDPDHPGLYYFAGPSFAADPDHPGLYAFQEEAP
ncbi:hypothetical protein HWD94_03930 [Pseudarthrobacter equi]|uniref:hypothetical protein n=1 Tax=Pseudarthrobacter equi TaxID=728066 RepID=UPI0021C10968|nr:hypothetical protein [Pseudarthrobacter equi]MCT9624272.1 hypothetical protein [Pseudarthrobacter equi]